VKGCADSTPPQLPRDVPPAWASKIWLLADCDKDGKLQAWDMRNGTALSLGPVSMTPLPSLWISARSRLDIAIGPLLSDAAKQLQNLSTALPKYAYFRFPGSEAALTLNELRHAGSTLSFSFPRDAPGPVSVEILLSNFGSSGPTNFVDLSSKRSIKCGMDFVTYVPPGSSMDCIAAGLVTAAQRQFGCAAASISSAGESGLAFKCFQPKGMKHVLSLAGTEEQAVRSDLHKLLRLPVAPMLLPDCALPWCLEGHPRASGKLVNPHIQCGPQPGWWKGGSSTRTAYIHGLYEYAHYMQENFDDNGWGCAYRSLQTCVSWYRMQFYTSKALPSITDIQTNLKEIDEAHKDLKVGSKKWIGTTEGMYILQDYVGVECRIMFCHDTADMQSQAPQLLRHLETEGTPVMMGAGDKAFTLVGLCYDEGSGDVAYLIVDPHYTGADDLKIIVQKGWVGWKKLDFFEKSTNGGFINLCLPQVPKGVDVI